MERFGQTIVMPGLWCPAQARESHWRRLIRLVCRNTNDRYRGSSTSGNVVGRRSDPGRPGHHCNTPPSSRCRHSATFPCCSRGPASIRISIPSRTEFEQPHVDVAADEFERKAIARDEQPCLARTGDGSPGALKLLQVGVSLRFGRSSQHRHDAVPVTDTGRGRKSRSRQVRPRRFVTAGRGQSRQRGLNAITEADYKPCVQMPQWDSQLRLQYPAKLRLGSGRNRSWA